MEISGQVSKLLSDFIVNFPFLPDNVRYGFATYVRWMSRHGPIRRKYSRDLTVCVSHVQILNETSLQFLSNDRAG
jgi:hypothetical protein